MTSNIQETNLKLRAVYGSMPKPLLQQLSELHGLTIRDFARIFGISKAHAEAIEKQRAMPNLPLAIKIARYFETTVEEMFGWQVDDTGERKCLLVELPGLDVPIRMGYKHERDTLPLVREVADAIKVEGGIKKVALALRRMGNRPEREKADREDDR